MIRLAALLVCASTAVAFADPPGLTPLAPLAPLAPLTAEPARPLLAPPGLAIVDRPAPLPLLQTQTTSYHGQIVLADVASLAVLVASAKGDSSGGAILGLASYAITPAIIHASHHHADRAITSLLLRVGLPILGGLVGSAVGRCSTNEFGDEDDCDGQIAATALGIVIGAATASVIDAAYIARGDDAVPPQAPGIHF